MKSAVIASKFGKSLLLGSVAAFVAVPVAYGQAAPDAAAADGSSAGRFPLLQSHPASGYCSQTTATRSYTLNA